MRSEWFDEIQFSGIILAVRIHRRRRLKVPTKANFNRNHPELRDGEVFITNAFHDSNGRFPDDPRRDWEAVGWKSKRAGAVAYTTSGKRIRGMFPIFAKRSELLKAGINPDDLWCL